MNKYTKWYNQITERARNRIIDTYTETHHVQPRSLGGTDDASNLVELTAREHFICHWLLTKIHIGDSRNKMLSAFFLMKGNNSYQNRYINGRAYEILREEYAQYISKMNTGRVQPPEEKAKQIAAITGRKRKPFSEEWRQKMSESHRGEKNHRYGVELSEETRQKIGNKIRGRKQTEEEKQRRGEANRGKVKPKQLCPHCQQMIAVNTYPRWHGDRCQAR
jgi:hypothetical protein